MSDDAERLFVYGTLRRGGRSAARRALEAGAELLSRATLPGRLYVVSDAQGRALYPALVPSSDPAAVVRGEVYTLREPAALLERLDAYEGVSVGDPRAGEYRREIASVTLEGGGRVRAHVYFYNASVDGLRVVPDGDFDPLARVR